MNSRFRVRLQGIKPILFDRYAGNNTTNLPPEQKMYVSPRGVVCLPVINIYAALATESPTSAVKMEFGKQAKKVAIGVQAFLGFDVTEVPFTDDAGEEIVFSKFDGERFKVLNHVAKVKKGSLSVPLAKERPCMAPPWNLRFECTLNQNQYCTDNDLRALFTRAQIMGFGTFRPQFGGFRLLGWDKLES